MLWFQGLLSASFSVPRCSRPMWGSARSMTSPLRGVFRLVAAAAGSRDLVGLAGTDDLGHQHARLDADRLVNHALLLGIVDHLDIAAEREVLAKRMPDEAVVGEQAPQVRMPLEQDAEQVEGLALEPVGAVPYRRY
jgi:hypothetical protein